MLDVLLASQPVHGPKLGAAAVSFASLATHAGLATLAVLAWHGEAVGAVARLADTTLVFLRPPVEEQKPAPPPAAERVAVTVLAATPPVKGFQTIPPVLDIPDEIPPVNLDERPFDPRDFSGRGVEGGVADGVVGGAIVDAGAAGQPVSAAVVYRAVQVDRVVELIVQPALRYPPALEHLAVPGTVVLEFVVGVDGRVEPGSVKVVEATDPRFVSAAATVARGSVFRPGELGGRKVRQLVRQRYRFSVAER
jgi:protein TonB